MTDTNKIALDPRKVNIRISVKSVQDLLDMLTNGTLTTNYPDIERRWWFVQNSQFIESILIPIPMTPIWTYADYEEDGKYIIFDGVKRIIALQRLFDPNYPDILSGLEFFPEYEGMRYSQLPHNIQRRILETPVPIHTIDRGTGIQEATSIMNRLRGK